IASHAWRVSRVRRRRSRSGPVHQTGASPRPDAPRDSRSRQSSVRRRANAMPPCPRSPRTKVDTDGSPSSGARRVLRHAARLLADVRSGPAKPNVDRLPGRGKPEEGEGAMKVRVEHWTELGALTTAGTVAATIFCCLPFATGVIGAALAAFGARLMPLQPVFVGLSLSALAYSFYQAYRPGATCSVDRCDIPTALRRRRLVLWVVAVAVVAMLTASWWANWVIYWSL